MFYSIDYIIVDSFPFMMELYIISKNDHACGASLITVSHVLSAAHCMVNETESDILVKEKKKISKKNYWRSIIQNLFIYIRHGQSAATQLIFVGLLLYEKGTRKMLMILTMMSKALRISLLSKQGMILRGYKDITI